MYKYEQAVRTSGVDCSGLTGVVTQYSGNPYGIAGKVGTRYFSGEKNEGTEANPKWVDDPKAKTLCIHKGNWKIDSDKEKETEQKEKDQKLLSYAVPGDVLVIGGRHVVIIQDLLYEGNNTVITDYSQVYVIHATQGGISNQNQWNIQKGDWYHLTDDDKHIGSFL